MEITSLNQQPQSLPIQLGTSGSNINDSCITGNVETCGAATLGALVTRRGTQYILSNSHVLALFGVGTGSVGDPIVQPGLRDTLPRECDTIKVTTVANLSQFTNPQTDTGTKVDAAIAQVVSGTVDSTGAILELGSTIVNGVPQPGAPAQGAGTAASVNEPVAKSGRSTGATCATVEAINVSVKVQYGPSCSGSNFTLDYSDEVSIGGAAFSAGGDSGSLIVDANTAQPVALIFAGDLATSLGNPVSDALNALKDANGNVPTFVGGAQHAVAACSLPAPSAALLPASPALSSQAIRRAAIAQSLHGPELLRNPAVLAVGVGASLDAPGDAALLLLVTEGTPRGPVPPVIDGVCTRIVESEALPPSGILDPAQSQALVLQSGSKRVNVLSSETIRNAVAVKEKVESQWMSGPAVQGLGVGASLDSPGDPALIFYVLQGKSHIPIPATIEGVRTRVKETPGFHAAMSGTRITHNCSNRPGTKRLGASTIH